MSNPSEPTTNATNVRRRLRGSGSVPVAVAAAEPVPESAEAPVLPRGGRSSDMIPRPKLSGLIARSRLDGRTVDPGTRTPLPHDLPRSEVFGDDLGKLQSENQELRGLIEQAIVQEEENERHAREWRRRIANLEEQISILKDGSGDTGHLVAQLQEREEAVRVLADQVQQLEVHLQYAQESAAANNIDQYVEAVQQRDEAIAALNTRVAELEQQIADVPPPPPTDEELARMADELERERCMINQLRKELDDEKKQHSEDESEMEKQMRDMEVQMSKERAEIARQRTELQRMQADLQAGAESISRNETSIRDRLQPSQRMASPDAAAPGSSTPERQQRESGFMTRLFGKR
jgi:chromosome segregation ATPase